MKANQGVYQLIYTAMLVSTVRIKGPYINCKGKSSAQTKVIFI